MDLFEGLKFSEEVRPELERHISKANFNRRRQQLKSSIEALRKDEAEVDEPCSMLLANLVADHLRTLNLNHSYTVFLREANLKSEEVVLRQDLLTVTNLQQSSKLNRLGFDHGKSALQILYEVSRQWQKPRLSSSTQTIESKEQLLPETYYDDKVNKLKIELEKVAADEKQHLVQQLTSELRANIRKEVETDLISKFQREKSRLEESMSLQKNGFLQQQQSLTSRYKLEISSVEKILTQSRKEVQRLKDELQDALKKIKQHKCLESEEYTGALTALKEQSKRMREKENEYKLAIANINTTVEDVISQKEVLLMNEDKAQQLRSDKLRKAKGIDDQAAKALLTAIKNMEERVKLLSEENAQLREELDNRSRKVFQLDRQLSSIQQEYANSQLSLEISGIKPIQKRPTKSVGVHVHEDMIKPPAVHKPQSEDSEQQRERQQQQKQLIEYLEQANKKKLESTKQMDSLKLDMARIKRRVRNIIDEPL